MLKTSPQRAGASIAQVVDPSAAPQAVNPSRFSQELGDLLSSGDQGNS
jgi:hypothetical protein